MSTVDYDPVRNVRVTVAYSYQNKWYEKMTKTEFNNARRLLKEKLAELHPISTPVDEIGLSPDKAQRDLEYAVKHVTDGVDGAIDKALNVLNKSRQKKDPKAAVLKADRGNCTGPVCTQIEQPPWHLNSITVPLLNGGKVVTGKLPIPAARAQEPGIKAPKAPILLQIQWDCTAGE